MENRMLPAFEKNNIPVIISSNNLYVPYAGVFIQSLANNASPDKNYDIIILERDISTANKQLLKQFEQKYKNISIRFHDPSLLFESFDVSAMETKQYPLEVYYKILAPYIFRDYRKIVVVDIDTLLKRDIAELFETDLGDCCVGAALDVPWWEGFYNSNHAYSSGEVHREYYRDVLGSEECCAYVNSGVLVVDVEEYCKYMSIEELLTKAQSRQFMYPDQDVLNALFKDKIKHLDLSWNVMVAINSRAETALSWVSKETLEAYNKACEAPALLHWAGKPKPWVCPDVLLGYEWWAVAMQTPFVGHIVARMLDALEDRREYYMNRYGKKVAVWEPTPGNVERKI